MDLDGSIVTFIDESRARPRKKSKRKIRFCCIPLVSTFKEESVNPKLHDSLFQDYLKTIGRESILADRGIIKRCIRINKSS
jgi:hypothetical protein